MHVSFYVLLLHTVTAFVFQDKNDIYEVTFMQRLLDPSAFAYVSGVFQ